MVPEDLVREAYELLPLLTAWRRDFHRHPELGLECHRTAAKVLEHLQTLGWEASGGWAQTGVVGVLYPPRERGGRAVALRVDMDGLPLQEATGAPYASVNPGVAHACGHDGHLAVGLGVAELLSRHRDKLACPVKLIFQPGEEHPGGAAPMIEQGVLDNPQVDAVFGFHLFPDLPAGHFGLRYGVMTAGSTDFSIVLRGKGGHAGHPHLSVDPVPALAAFVDAVQLLVSRATGPLVPLVISFGRIYGGSVLNAIPEEVCLEGTVRALSEEIARFAVGRMREILAGLRLTHGVEGEFRELGSEPAMFCDPAVTSFAEECLVAMWGRDRVIRITEPSMGSEDFARFARAAPATYIRIGIRDAQQGFLHPLHHPAFDFDEGALPPAVAGMAFLLLQWGRR